MPRILQGCVTVQQNVEPNTNLIGQSTPQSDSSSNYLPLSSTTSNLSELDNTESQSDGRQQFDGIRTDWADDDDDFLEKADAQIPKEYYDKIFWSDAQNELPKLKSKPKPNPTKVIKLSPWLKKYEEKYSSDFLVCLQTKGITDWHILKRLQIDRIVFPNNCMKWVDLLYHIVKQEKKELR